MISAVALLMGFYLIGFGLLGLVIVIDALVLAIPWFDAGKGKFVVLSLIFVFPTVRGMLARRDPEDRKPPGVPITEGDEPVLWQRIRELAHHVGTRPPAEIRLISDVNAAVQENARFLGLIPGKRRMYIGVPLLIGLTRSEFDAVIAHELGHYANHDTRMAGLIYRGRRGVLRTVELYGRARGTDSVMFRLYKAYAERYLRTTQAISRGQELAADLDAVRIAGRANAAAALRQIPALDAAFEFYMSRYVTTGWDLGLLPSPNEFFVGFARMLTAPPRQAELDAIRAEPPEQEAHPFDSHPPIQERIAMIEALPDDGRPLDDKNARATMLLRDPQAAFTVLARSTLADEAAQKRIVDWPTLMHEAGRARAAEGAQPLVEAVTAATGRPDALVALLDLVDQGRRSEVTARLALPEEVAHTTGRVRAEHQKTLLSWMLRPLTELNLAERGAARWAIDWAEIDRFELRAGAPVSLDDALDAVLAQSPDSRAMRALLGA
ncbi:M48 family metallopeptidase [Actinomadura sp. HBU206391]|uniref:M48 family metallopeptidase n=1 Tax=Actinomadura sp. HBU206391 TaxID=2731692 RepID=UPI0016508654|nr:M48 family metallopeptidase [Actinomadura sp. HBU206391]MBC6458878.1 M48 family metalloprotease [Actinomadura sp. HBU206391]